MDNFRQAFFTPQSVAIIGASADPTKLSHAIVDNMSRYGFRGHIYPINPKGGIIVGHQAYPSVLDVPGDIDLAVIVIPAPLVAKAMEQCGEKGIKGVIVITAGFREIGGEGMKMERALVEIARKYRMRMIGPNCIGIIDTVIPLNTSFTSGMPKPGNIAFMTQSGALAQAVLDWAAGQGIGFSRFVSIGNKADCNEDDFMRAWGDDPSSQVILAYLEDIRNGSEFMRLARQVGREKQTPIIAIKSGVTDAGTRAISSHTGSLGGVRARLRCRVSAVRGRAGEFHRKPLWLLGRLCLSAPPARQSHRRRHECGRDGRHGNRRRRAGWPRDGASLPGNDQ